jgi:hypothetical protein
MLLLLHRREPLARHLLLQLQQQSTQPYQHPLLQQLLLQLL